MHKRGQNTLKLEKFRRSVNMKSKELCIQVRIIELNKAKNLYKVISKVVGMTKSTLEYT